MNPADNRPQGLLSVVVLIALLALLGILLCGELSYGARSMQGDRHSGKPKSACCGLRNFSVSVFAASFERFMFFRRSTSVATISGIATSPRCFSSRLALR